MNICIYTYIFLKKCFYSQIFNCQQWFFTLQLKIKKRIMNKLIASLLLLIAPHCPPVFECCVAKLWLSRCCVCVSQNYIQRERTMQIKIALKSCASNCCAQKILRNPKFVPKRENFQICIQNGCTA